MKLKLEFLKEIQHNNNKEWFDENKPKYDVLNKEFKAFVKEVEKGLAKYDQIEEGKVFRIYRDVRFSSDKTPYKLNMSGYFQRASPRLRGGYYIHFQPGESFVGGGFWNPENHDLKRIRDEFAFDHKSIEPIVSDTIFQQYFGKIDGDSLKTAPRGFDKEHIAIDLIKMKSYVVKRPFTDAEVQSESFVDETVKTFIAMMPFFNYMSQILTTNLNGESILEG
jgi:uncharacterized protein (TIGR02453 family)